jgi:hypothetical protein
MRELGVTACAQLQSKKCSEVELVASSGVKVDSLAPFYNSFTLSNYDWNLKSKIEDADESKKD